VFIFELSTYNQKKHTSNNRLQKQYRQSYSIVLFQRDKSGILRQIKNTFEEGKLNKEAVVAKFAAVQKEGNRTISRGIDHYNLDVIISVGYRVKSHRGTPFRIWATERLREYII
jgi:hypothetical protein